MASSNIARLGVVLGLNTAELTADVNKSIDQFRTLKSQIKRESEAAAKEILSLKYATEDYGKEVSKVTQVERELTSGRLKNAAPDLQRILREQAKAYDDVVAASKKYAQEQSVAQQLSDLKVATDTYGQSLTKVQQVERDVVKFNLVDQAKIDALRQQAAAYDRVADSAKRAQATESLVRDIQALKFATDDYGRSLTKLEQVNRDIAGGKYQLADQAKIASLRQQAQAYDQVAEAAKKTHAAESLSREIQTLKFATEDYGKTLTKVQQVERDIALGKYRSNDQQQIQQLLAQARAYDQVAKSGRDVTKGLTEQQKLALTYQTTDLVTQIASGQNAMIALMQQGGQLKDQMGGIGPMFTAIRMALTPMVLGVTAAATAVGILGFAFYQGAKESADLRDQLILTGNYANLTQKTFLDLANTVSIKTNLSIGKTKDILMELVKSGKFTDESMGSVAQAIANVAKLSGETASEVAQKLIPAFDGGAGSIKSLNDKMHFLTLEQYKHIVLLDKQGKAQEAAKIAADALNQKFGEQERRVGDLERVWEKLKNTASATWNALLNIGRPMAPEEEINQLTKFIIDAGVALSKANPESPNYDKLLEGLRAHIAKRQQLIDKMEAGAQSAKKSQAETEAINDEAKNGEKRRQLNSEIDAAIIKNRADAQKFATDEERKIFIDAEAAKQTAIRATIEKNRAEGNVFEAENARKLAQELVQIEQQKQEQLKQIAERRAQLVFEREKLEAKNAFDVKRKFANDIQLIEIDAQEKLESARSEIANKNRVERNLFAKENAALLAQQEIAIEQEKQNKLRELAKRRYAADMADRQNVADQVMADLAQEESRKSQLFNNLVEQGQKEKESLDYEMQKLQLKQGLIGASDEALQIAMSELETQRRIAEIMANPDLSPEKKDQLVGQAKKTQGMREMFISMQEGLKNTQQIYDSVFGNMERALENFVRTGKLSFKDLARSIIQDLILIQMRAAASQLFSTFFSAMGFITPAGGAGTITGGSGIKMRAMGGPVTGGDPYIVGERGPEMFVPRSSGTIVPNHAMGSMGGTQVINNYNIQAIDVKSFEDRIMGSNRAVWAANTYANKTFALGQGRV